jgi:hypothetical protein
MKEEIAPVADEIPAIVDIEALNAGTRVTLASRCTLQEPCGAKVSYGAEKGTIAVRRRLSALLRRA